MASLTLADMAHRTAPSSSKKTKTDANYRKGNTHKHCGLCQMFRPPRSCTAVEGPIRPTDLCDLFKRAFSRHHAWYGENKNG